jgi:exodeoxyribonuclease VIII
METGRYENISNKDYHKAKGLSSSIIKMMSNPGDVKWYMDCPQDQEKVKTFDFGTAIHTSLLEPEKFNDQFAIEPKVNKRTSAGKAEIAEFQKEHGHKMILSADEKRKLGFMTGSVLAYPYSKTLFEHQTGTEISYFVEDPETGLMLKSRNDMESVIQGETIISDIKTIDDIKDIAKNIYEFGYHLQAAHYNHCFKLQHGFEPYAFLFIFISKKISGGRYPCQVVELKEYEKDLGEEKRQEYTAKYKQCLDTGIWPGVRCVGFPKWARK